ncbi:MAG: aspartate carbamoyltransferase catalytic subunit [Armatimonadetes bacterium]|nr:aspartate carbamoyltransferase catalytic subunit [Armatimonadota bacterium]
MTRNLLGIRHLDVETIQNLISLGRTFKAKVTSGEKIEPMSDQVVGLLFFENSTRTRVSFEQAAFYLGLKCSNFAAAGSSISKGETLRDTILTLRHERLNGLVMRHRSSGSAQLAAGYFGGPVINAGDGSHEHPTQALGDALTIVERKGTLDGLVVAIVGDVEHSRVARSNAWLLSKMGAEVRFVGPRTMLPSHVSMLPGTLYHEMPAGLEGADVVMALRLQRERMGEGMVSSIDEFTRNYQVNREKLRFAKPDCLVMHPGPINRGIELDDISADGDHSVIHQQIENGIFVRMAALHWAFGGGAIKQAETKKSGKKVKA